MLSDAEMVRVVELGSGRRKPENGMEKHFLRVICGECDPLTPTESEWAVFWKELDCGDNIDISSNPSEILNQFEVSTLRRRLDQLNQDLQRSSELLSEYLERIQDLECRLTSEKVASTDQIFKLKVELAEYRFRFGECDKIKELIEGRGWRSLEQEQLRAWREIRLNLGLPIPAEIEQLELHKPEWLRGITGKGPPRTAGFFPADRD